MSTPPIYDLPDIYATSEYDAIAFQFLEGPTGEEVPVDLTNTDILMQFRNVDKQLIYEFGTVAGNMQIDAAADGRCSTIATAISVSPGTYAYDLFTIPSGGTARARLRGKVTVYDYVSATS